MANKTKEQLEVFSEYIRQKGLRMTRQRELVVETFLRTEGHMSTDELYDLVRDKDGKIGYATVFRTLKALTDCGLARETDLDDGRTRFEHLYKRPQHHHIVCVECNRTIEFFSPELLQLQDRITAQYQFKALRNKFQIFGICSQCQSQQKGESKAKDKTYETALVFARDALKIAMETEKRGMHFYQTASDIVARPLTRKTFLRMLEDEKSHYSNLKKEWDKLVDEHPGVLDAPVFLHFDFEALSQIFPSRNEINRNLRPDMTEEEALRLAMAMERDAHDFFRSYAKKFSDTQGRNIFLRFAEEEQEHYDTIRAALSSLVGES